MQDKFADALFDNEPAVSAKALALIADPPSFSSQARLNVYRNNVQHSLYEVLTQSFPVVEALVGATAFKALAVGFIRQHPPASPYLTEYGELLPHYLAQRPEMAPYPFVPAVAELEFRILRATHAADTPPITHQLEALVRDPDRLLRARFTFAAPVAMIASPFPIETLWRAHQQATPDLSDVALDSPQWLLVSRPLFRVEVDSVNQSEFRFLEALQRGLRVEEAIEYASADLDLIGCFARLEARRLISAVD